MNSIFHLGYYRSYFINCFCCYNTWIHAVLFGRVDVNPGCLHLDAEIGFVWWGRKETFTVIQWVNPTCKQRAKNKDQIPQNCVCPSESHMLTEIWDWSCDSTLGSAHREQKHPSTVMVLHWHPLPGRTRHCVIVQLYQLGRNPLLNFYGLLKVGLDFHQKKKKKASYSGCQFQLNKQRGSREPFLADHIVLFGITPTQNGDSALRGPALSTTERPTNRGGSTAGLTNTYTRKLPCLTLGKKFIKSWKKLQCLFQGRVQSCNEHTFLRRSHECCLITVSFSFLPFPTNADGVFAEEEKADARTEWRKSIYWSTFSMEEI